MRALESKIRELELTLEGNKADYKREFKSIKAPLVDQLQRATRENESLQRELGR